MHSETETHEIMNGISDKFLRQSIGNKTQMINYKVPIQTNNSVNIVTTEDKATSKATLPPRILKLDNAPIKKNKALESYRAN